jgi:hypothetical protein
MQPELFLGQLPWWKLAWYCIHEFFILFIIYLQVTLDAVTKKPIEIPPEFFERIGVFYREKPDSPIPLLLPHAAQAHQ